VNDSRID